MHLRAGGMLLLFVGSVIVFGIHITVIAAA
jgi:hypothetical protein